VSAVGGTTMTVAATLRRRLVGLFFLAVLAAAAWLSLALYQKQFTPVVMVTLDAGSVGNEMSLGAEVKVRGVDVGEVRQISSNGASARLLLAIQPGIARLLPANVTAEMLPTTLFGERYVDLVLPASPVQARLADVRVIGQARSRDAIEVQRVLDDVLPLLQAIRPDQLSVALTAIAQGLRGRGREFGQSLVEFNQLLGKLNPALPALDADLRELAGFGRTYARASPDLLAALNDLTVTSQTIVAERSQLSSLYSTVSTASTDFATFLRANNDNIIRLSVGSTGVLRALARYAPEFPCTLADLVRLEPLLNRSLGKGTRQPGVHVIAHVVPARGRYLPNVDTPRFTRNTGPRCFTLPLGPATGHAIRSGTYQPPILRLPGARIPARFTAAVITPAAMTAGLPADGELIRELSALALGRTPQSLPGWSSLLTGPLFRGTTVTLERGR